MGQASPHALRSLIVAQAVGSFNTSALKLFIALLAVNRLAGGAKSETIQQQQVTLAFVVFTLPFVLISLPAGVIADRFSKRTVLLVLRAIESVILLGVMFTLILDSGGGPELFFFLALIGITSAVFSPALYGILPELVPHERLSSANGAVAMWTFLAVIAGTGGGGILLDVTNGGQTWLVGLLLAVLAGIGGYAAFTLPAVAPARSQGGVADTVRSAWTAVRADRVLWLTILGQGLYWTIVTLVGTTIPVFARQLVTEEAAKNTLTVLPLLVLGLGTAAGSIGVGRLSAGKIEVGFIPLGGTGIAFCTLLLGALGPSVAGMVVTLIFMAVLGVSSGCVNVPLNALLQWRVPADRRGAVIALCNVLTFAGILLGSLLGFLLAQADYTSGGILVWAGLLTLAGTIWATYLVPEAFLRLVLVLTTHTLYRLRIHGRENVPQEGGALLTPNHVTFVDAALLIASTDRPIRFLVDASYFHHWLYKPFMKALGAIPISASGGPRMILRAPARRRRLSRQGRAGLHLPRRTTDAHRHAATVPARPGAHRQGTQRADHSGVHGSRLGQHLQPFGRALPVEDAGAHPLPHHDGLRQTATGRDDGR